MCGVVCMPQEAASLLSCRGFNSWHCYMFESPVSSCPPPLAAVVPHAHDPIISCVPRPGLLVDVVSVLKDINVNVVSAEIDTIGNEARDEFFVTYHGEPLNGPMVQLVTNSLQVWGRVVALPQGVGAWGTQEVLCLPGSGVEGVAAWASGDVFPRAAMGLCSALAALQR